MTKENQKLNINILKLKKMNNLKLNKLEEQNLAERQMYAVKGGGVGDMCGCGCCYANNGGSSVSDNALANSQGGLVSTGCKPVKYLSYKFPREYWEE
jgi:natural product precursor